MAFFEKKVKTVNIKFSDGQNTKYVHKKPSQTNKPQKNKNEYANLFYVKILIGILSCFLVLGGVWYEILSSRTIKTAQYQDHGFYDVKTPYTFTFGDNGYTRTGIIKIGFELYIDAKPDYIDSQLPKFDAAMMANIRALTASDLTGPDSIGRIRDIALDAATKVYGDKIVRNVKITDFRLY